MDKRQLAGKIANLIKLAKSESNENQFIDFEIGVEVVAEMDKLVPTNLSGYKFMIDVYAIRHIFKQHGNPVKEKQRGQIPVYENDLLLVLDILENADSIFYDGKSRNNKDIFVFQKQLENVYVVILEVRIGKKRIALHSLRVLKTKKNQDWFLDSF